jgi:mRNA-degrading endonuclease YafQ of YafQ-DinJ toxin-antitoxin module
VNMNIKLIETGKFIRKANKLVRKNKFLDRKLEVVLDKLVSNPFDPSLKTHKLKGKLSEFYSASRGSFGGINFRH